MIQYKIGLLCSRVKGEYIRTSVREGNTRFALNFFVYCEGISDLMKCDVVPIEITKKYLLIVVSC